MGTTIQLWRGFDQVLEYTVESSPGVPKQINVEYDRFVVDFDDEQGATDKASVEGSIEDDGTEDLRGRVDFEIPRATTVGWSGDTRIRYQVRGRTTDGKWHPCGGPDAVVVHDRVADDDAF